MSTVLALFLPNYQGALATDTPKAAWTADELTPLDGAWYRRAAGLQHDVTIAPAEPASRNVIDAAYRAKYAHFGDTTCSRRSPSRP